MPDSLKFLDKAATVHELPHADIVLTLVKDYVKHRQAGASCMIVSAEESLPTIDAAVYQALKQEGLLGKEHSVKQLVVKDEPICEAGDYVYWPNALYDPERCRPGDRTHLYYKIAEAGPDYLFLEDPTLPQTQMQALVMVPLGKFLSEGNRVYKFQESQLAVGECIQIPNPYSTLGIVTDTDRIVTFLGTTEEGYMRVQTIEGIEEIVSPLQTLWERGYAENLNHLDVSNTVDQVLLGDLGDLPYYDILGLSERRISMGSAEATIYTTDKTDLEDIARYVEDLRAFQEQENRVMQEAHSRHLRGMQEIHSHYR